MEWKDELRQYLVDNGTKVTDAADNPVTDLHEKFKNKETRATLDGIESALSRVVSDFSTVYVIVDALDECADDGTRHKFVRHLQNLQSRADVRLLATSRFHSDIEDQFQGTPTLEIIASDEDIKRYVAAQVDDLPRCVQYDEILLQQVQEKITKAVEGMQVTKVHYKVTIADEKTLGSSSPSSL